MALLAVLLPIGVHIRNVSWEESQLVVNIFPIFGLLAFTLLWFHSIMGVFEEYFREMFDFDRFVDWTATIILVSIILHPLLILILVDFNFPLLLSGHKVAMWLGITGFLLLITYDIAKPWKFTYFSKYWNTILIVSTIGFILTFFHSLLIGSDLQGGFMRVLWYFYGITGILATIYTYGIKRFLRKEY